MRLMPEEAISSSRRSVRRYKISETRVPDDKISSTQKVKNQAVGERQSSNPIRTLSSPARKQSIGRTFTVIKRKGVRLRNDHHGSPIRSKVFDTGSRLDLSKATRKDLRKIVTRTIDHSSESW